MFSALKTVCPLYNREFCMENTSEKQSGKIAYGFTDEAASEDQFKISEYIKGLGEFIQNCNI